jgi:two-component system OmpR family response regulator
MFAHDVAPPDRVLLVEDDDATRELFANALRFTGFQVRTAADGLGGLRVLDSFDPDVIVLDLGLPIASGFEVLHELRAQARTHDIPVIAISGHDRGVELARVNPEFFAALAKPFDTDTLVRAVRLALRLQHF